MYDGAIQYVVVTYEFTGKEHDSESGFDNFGARFDSSSAALCLPTRFTMTLTRAILRVGMNTPTLETTRCGGLGFRRRENA